MVGPIEDSIDHDDVDLLGSRDSVNALLDAVYEWVSQGLCHVRIRAGSDRKVSLTLLSSDACHRLDFDLWTELRQIDGRLRSLRYEDCAPAIINPDESLQRLPVWIEASIFIHHLVSKNKQISSPKQLSRLAKYAEDSRNEGKTELADALLATARDAAVSAQTESLTLSLLEDQLEVPVVGAISRSLARVRTALVRFWFMPPKRLRMLGIMGCDGCGKTSLSKTLAKESDAVSGMYVGKHLYRKNLIYKALVIFLRPLIARNRESFDDKMAPLLYFIASLHLEAKLLFWRKPGILLVDRSLVDFLMLARKTDRPHFSRFLFLTSLMGKRLTHIHFIVPFEELKMRKAEMTEQGHKIYDKRMFDHFSKRTPTDHILYNNSGSLSESKETLKRIIDWLTK